MMRGKASMAAAAFVFSTAIFCSAQQKSTSHHPRISMAQAEQTALAKEPGTIRSRELESEKGTLIYSFDIDTGGSLHEVNVDARTGKIVADTVETPAGEAKERLQDSQKTARPKQ